MIVPPIKCQGIKTKLVQWIKTKVPTSFNTWYEPFMGSGVVGFNIKPRKAVFADTNPHIIQFYKDIQNEVLTSSKVKEFLYREGAMLTDGGAKHFNFIRDRFNCAPNSFDFLFLNRSCFNGIMRFNKKGGFNVPFCHKPERFSKAYISKISNQIDCIASIIVDADYDFNCCSFEEIIAQANKQDLIYCDPPYIERYSDYYGAWNEEKELTLAKLLKITEAKFILSTWHHNMYRENTHIAANYNGFEIDTREHFYHVGANEENRHLMIECLVCNHDTNNCKTEKELLIPIQTSLYDLLSINDK